MLNLSSIDYKTNDIETLVVPVCEDMDIHANRTVASLVKKAKTLPGFSGKKEDESVILFNPSRTKIKQVIFAGLGKKEEIVPEDFRLLSGKAIRVCIKRNISKAAFAVPSARKTGISAKTFVTAMMEGAYLGNHVNETYKSEKESTPLDRIDFFAGPSEKNVCEGIADRVEMVCEETIRVREWVTMPSNDKRPEEFSKILVEQAKSAGLKVRVLDHEELEKNNFHALLAVARGSKSKPRLVVIDYSPKNPEKTIALVGKGVTFDSGGLDLKPGRSMTTMKMDMAGAATVCGTLLAVAKTRPGNRIIGVLPLVENMPSGDAYRPGDVLNTYLGKTVEIGSTDAEGRLILIDSLAWAVEKYKPDTIIDIATLTGACIVALGEKIAGVFSNDDLLGDAILRSGENTFERCWRMPLPKDYKKLFKSEFADMNNVNTKGGAGSITAALFLSEFVKDTKWAHIDIAGPAWTDKKGPYQEAGGTGFGVRLFCDLLENL